MDRTTLKLKAPQGKIWTKCGCRYTTKVLTELTPGDNAIKDNEIRDWVNETLAAKGKSSKIASFKVI